eukprot:m.186797 g.186797  ORF g.186797 m.186797 type:complete len:790 (+) comp39355_c0_seq1:25-2394(+)
MSSSHKFPSFYFPSQLTSSIAGWGNLSSVAYLPLQDSFVEPVFRRLVPRQPSYSSLRLKPLAPSLPIQFHSMGSSLPVTKQRASPDQEIHKKILNLGSSYQDALFPYETVNDVLDAGDQRALKDWRKLSRKNCLGVLAPSMPSKNPIGAVLYPVNSSSKNLDVSLLSYPNKHKKRPLHLDLHPWQTYTLCETPLQVVASPLLPGKKGTVAVSSSSNCTVFSSPSVEGFHAVYDAYCDKKDSLQDFIDADDPEFMCGNGDPKLVSPLASFCCKSFIVDLAVSPYSVGEVAISSATGAVYLWSPSQRLERVCPPTVKMDGFETVWSQCRFSAHPKQLFLAHKRKLSKLDLRTGTMGESLLPSKHENFSSILTFCVHPDREFSVLYGTQEYLVLMDERYMQEPLLAWKHQLKSLPQSIDVRMCVEDQIGCHHVVAVTGSEMGDMSLFYYRDGVDVLVSKTSVPAILNGNTSLRLPAQTTGCKADVSHPTDWVSVLDIPLECSLPRLLREVPVIGSSMTTLVRKDGSQKTNLFVLQLTAEGNLYNQTFLCSVDRDGSKGKYKNDSVQEFGPVPLSQSTVRKIQKWASESYPPEKKNRRKARMSNFSEMYKYALDYSDGRLCLSCWVKRNKKGVKEKRAMASQSNASVCCVCRQSLTKPCTARKRRRCNEHSGESEKGMEMRDIKRWRSVAIPTKYQSELSRRLWTSWNESDEEKEEEQSSNEWENEVPVRRRGPLGRGIKNKWFTLSDDEGQMVETPKINADSDESDVSPPLFTTSPHFPDGEANEEMIGTEV